MKSKTKLSRLWLYLPCVILLSFFGPSASAQNAQAIALRYCSPGDYPEWTTEMIKRTPGVDWQFYRHPEAAAEAFLMSFMHPPGWRVSTLGRLPLMVARVTSPDGSVAMQLVMGYPNTHVSARQAAESAIKSLMGQKTGKVVCVRQWPNAVPELQTVALAIQADSTLYFSVGTVYNSPYAAFIDSRTVAAPLAQFDSWALKVLSAWSNSIPRGGQGSGCEVGDPDSDHDGVCDHKDLYPNDPRRW